MRPGTYEEVPLVKRQCLWHRLMLLRADAEDEDARLVGYGDGGQTRRDVMLRAVRCRRCRARNGLSTLPRA